jgi:uncharacterized protein YecA (UPF0149 family)
MEEKRNLTPAEIENIYNEYKFSHLTKAQREAILSDVRIEPKINRNEPCPCGSGKKYKHCCINK